MARTSVLWGSADSSRPWVYFCAGGRLRMTSKLCIFPTSTAGDAHNIGRRRNIASLPTDIGFAALWAEYACCAQGCSLELNMAGGKRAAGRPGQDGACRRTRPLKSGFPNIGIFPGARGIFRSRFVRTPLIPPATCAARKFPAGERVAAALYAAPLAAAARFTQR